MYVIGTRTVMSYEKSFIDGPSFHGAVVLFSLCVISLLSPDYSDIFPCGIFDGKIRGNSIYGQIMTVKVFKTIKVHAAILDEHMNFSKSTSATTR